MFDETFDGMFVNRRTGGITTLNGQMSHCRPSSSCRSRGGSISQRAQQRPRCDPLAVVALVVWATDELVPGSHVRFSMPKLCAGQARCRHAHGGDTPPSDLTQRRTENLEGSRLAKMGRAAQGGAGGGAPTGAPGGFETTEVCGRRSVVADLGVDRLPVGGGIEMSEYGTDADGDAIEEEKIFGHLKPSGDVEPRPQWLVRRSHDLRHRLRCVGERLSVPAVLQRGAVELEQPIRVQP